VSGLKKRVETLTKILKDDVGSEIIIKSAGKIIARSKSAKTCEKLIRIVVNV